MVTMSSMLQGGTPALQQLLQQVLSPLLMHARVDVNLMMMMMTMMMMLMMMMLMMMMLIIDD